MSRSKNYVFTKNNYTEEDIHRIDSIDCKYMIYEKEIAPTTGTPHLQGFVVFHREKTRLAAIGVLGKGTFVEAARADELKNEKYCNKEGNAVVRGVRPLTSREKGDKEKDRWHGARLAAQEGRMSDIDDQIYVQYFSNLEAIRRKHMVKPQPLSGDLVNTWYWGAAGCGKTTKAWSEAPNAYIKDASTKWWDGYTDQEDVIVDDLDPYMIKMSSLYKQWTHHFPFNAETKGSSMLIRPKRVIVTSQYHPRQVWSDDATIAAIERRFKIIALDGIELNKIN